jgi:hypothetical protein
LKFLNTSLAEAQLPQQPGCESFFYVQFHLELLKALGSGGLAPRGIHLLASCESHYYIDVTMRFDAMTQDEMSTKVRR